MEKLALTLFFLFYIRRCLMVRLAGWGTRKGQDLRGFAFLDCMTEKLVGLGGRCDDLTLARDNLD